jgi:hypothetical protein
MPDTIFGPRHQQRGAMRRELNQPYLADTT